MIRLIFVQVNSGEAANVGGPVSVEHKTFDVDLPVVEKWLGEPAAMNDHWTRREFVGIEVLA